MKSKYTTVDLIIKLFLLVNVSYSNFRTNLTDPDDQKDNVEDENRDFDRFVVCYFSQHLFINVYHGFLLNNWVLISQSLEKEVASMPRCGYKKVGEGSGEVVTKHDILMSSRINACRVLEFPPGIQTGDTGGFDVKLDNKVYNSLRRHSHAQCSRNKAKVVKQTASSKWILCILLFYFKRISIGK